MAILLLLRDLLPGAGLVRAADLFVRPHLGVVCVSNSSRLATELSRPPIILVEQIALDDARSNLARDSRLDRLDSRSGAMVAPSSLHNTNEPRHGPEDAAALRQVVTPPRVPGHVGRSSYS